MRVTVEYFGPARDAAGVGSESTDCEAGLTAQSLVEQIARNRGGRLASLLLTDGKLSRSVLLAVNDHEVADAKPLAEGDAIAIIPPVSGGAR